MNSLMERVGLHELEETLETFQDPTRTRRERLIEIVFCRFAEIYDKTFYKTLRRFTEFSMLVHSILAFTTLTTMHLTYINNPSTSNCLADICLPVDRPIILRIEVKRSNDFEDRPPDPGHDPILRGLSEAIKANDSTNSHWSNEGILVFDWLNFLSAYPVMTSHWLDVFNLSMDRMSEKFFSCFTAPNSLVVEYSESSGLLLLSETERTKLGVPVTNVTLDPDTSSCFGSNIYKKVFLEEFFSFRDVVAISLENLLIANNITEGYYTVLNSNSVVKLTSERTTPFPRVVIATVSMVIFVIFSSLLLQYSYNTFSEAIVDLVYFNYQPSSLPLVSMVTSVIAIFGFRDLMKFMFYDNLTFALNLLVIWMANQFYAICCHSNISKRYWSRFFFLYHFAFYIYYVRHKGRFSVLAMATSWFFIQHSMMYFFHHYELPAMNSRLRVRRALTELRRNGSGILDRIRFRINQNPRARVIYQRATRGISDDNNNIIDDHTNQRRNNALIRSSGSRIRLAFMIREQR